MGGLTGHAVIKSKRLLALLAGNNSLTLHISWHAEPKCNTKSFNKLSYICICVHVYNALHGTSSNFDCSEDAILIF